MKLCHVLVALSIGCGGGDPDSGGDPQALSECLDSCDVDRGACDDSCESDAQAFCSDTCVNLSSNCRGGFCASFTSGSPERLTCENACTRYEGSCQSSCPQRFECIDSCDTELDNCIGGTCAQFASGSGELASCTETCVDTAGACLERCPLDTDCPDACGDNLGDCQNACEQDFGGS